MSHVKQLITPERDSETPNCLFLGPERPQSLNTPANFSPDSPFKPFECPAGFDRHSDTTSILALYSHCIHSGSANRQSCQLHTMRQSRHRSRSSSLSPRPRHHQHHQRRDTQRSPHQSRSRSPHRSRSRSPSLGRESRYSRGAPGRTANQRSHVSAWASSPAIPAAEGHCAGSHQPEPP